MMVLGTYTCKKAGKKKKLFFKSLTFDHTENSKMIYDSIDSIDSFNRGGELFFHSIDSIDII